MKKFIIKLFLVGCSIVLSCVSNAANQIRFGVIYFYPPFVFSSKSSGYIHGFDIELANTICQQLNAQCTFTAMSLSQMFSSLDANKVDAIMGGLSITPQRKERFAFTRPYLKSTMSYVALINGNFDPNNIQGKRIGVVKDSAFYAYLVNKYANSIKVITYDTNEEVANALSNKEIDAMLIDTPAATYWVGYSTGLFKIVGTPTFLSFDQGYGIAMKKDNTSLLNAFNNALNTIISNGTFDKIKKSYFSNQQPKTNTTANPQ